MPKQYAVTITVTVTDEDALANIAAITAGDQGIEPADWQETRDKNGDPIAADLRMIFDPGVSPDGTAIDDSAAEFIATIHQP